MCWEYTGGSSRKFWEAGRDGVAVTVRYGRIGTEGRTTTKEFASEAEAIAHLDRLVVRALIATRDALLHAGEVLTTGRDVAPDVAARVAADTGAPPDLHGAAFGLGWSLGATGDPVRALRGAAGPSTLGRSSARRSPGG